MAFRMHFPEVELTLQELTTAPHVQALRERRIDVGDLHPRSRAEAFALKTIYRDPFVVVLPHTQPTRQSGISRHIICRHAQIGSLRRHPPPRCFFCHTPPPVPSGVLSKANALPTTPSRMCG